MVPLQTEVMRESHDIPAVGHRGRDRTMAKIKEKYFWYHLTSDIEKYVASCSGVVRKIHYLVGVI